MARDSADARVPTNPRGHIEGLWGLDATSDSLDDSQTELTSIEAV